jgi:hypothetical protein
MQPDIKREQRNGWLVLGAIAALSVISLGWYSYDDPLAAKLESAKADYAKLHGPEPMSIHIKRQRQANQTLNQTIEELKHDSEAPAAEYFTITEKDLKSGEHEKSIFNARYSAVRDECDEQARNFGLRNWEQHSNLGFSEKEQLPSDEDAPYMLTMLQLTRRAARICFSSPPGDEPDPIKSLDFIHEPMQRRPTGPAGRPAMLTEFPLTVSFSATLPQTMWILWRFTVGKVDELQQPSKPEDRIEDHKRLDDNGSPRPWDDGAYPFILQGITIKSPETEELKPNVTPNFYLTVTLHLAAMRFVSAATRDLPGAAVGKSAPVIPQSSSTHPDFILPSGHPVPRN